MGRALHAAWLWTGYFLLISLLILVTLEVAARWRWRLCNGCVVYVRQKILAIARDLELPTIDVIQRSSSWGGMRPCRTRWVHISTRAGTPWWRIFWSTFSGRQVERIK
jgi:hypothetical protein